MGSPSAGHRFGFAWLAFGLAIALHVIDEATHDFLSVYNPSAAAIHARFPFLPVPTFTFAGWLTALGAAIALFFSVSPLAFRGLRGLRLAAVPLAAVFGVFNACLHLLSSVYFHRWMPGVYSSPVLLGAAVFLIVVARESKEEPGPAAASGRR